MEKLRILTALRKKDESTQLKKLQVLLVLMLVIVYRVTVVEDTAFVAG